MKIGDLVRDIQDGELGIVTGFEGDDTKWITLIKVLRICGKYDDMWADELEVISESR